MSDFKKNRIYRRLSEPWQFVGFTKDELALALVSLGTGLFFKGWFVRIFALIVGVLLVWGVKRLKKRTQGFCLSSYLHWHYGVVLHAKQTLWPHSSKRWWLA